MGLKMKQSAIGKKNLKVKAKSSTNIKLKKASAKLPISKVGDSILKALAHSEAEDGLYFRNFCNLHEEDQRPSVKASKKDLLVALNELLSAGLIKIDFDELEITFRLANT